MQGAYGSLDMAAQANSVQCLSVLSDGWTVGGVVLALLAIRLLLLAVAAAAVMLLSRRCACLLYTSIVVVAHRPGTANIPAVIVGKHLARSGGAPVLLGQGVALSGGGGVWPFDWILCGASGSRTGG